MNPHMTPRTPNRTWSHHASSLSTPEDAYLPLSQATPGSQQQCAHPQMNQQHFWISGVPHTALSMSPSYTGPLAHHYPLQYSPPPSVGTLPSTPVCPSPIPLQLINPPAAPAKFTDSQPEPAAGATRKRRRGAKAANPGPNSKKRKENTQVNTSSSIPLAASTEAPSTSSSSMTAETCGVGSIPSIVNSSIPAVSSHPALNTKIFLSKARRQGRGSNHLASDVWYHVRAVTSKTKPTVPLPPDNNLSKKRPKEGEYLACRLCTGNHWYAVKNTDGQSKAIRNHLKEHHWAVYRQSVLTLKLKGHEDITQEPQSRGSADREREPFSIETFHQKLVRWITVDDQSLDIVDCPELRELLLYIGVDIEDSDIPHRTLLTQLILQEFQKEIERTSNEMKHSIGRISLTSDMWSSSILNGYMAVTAHYMVKDESSGHLVLRSRLIAFRCVHGSHSGANMGKHLLGVLDEYGITDRLGMITLDNAANNDTMMRYIEEELRRRNIPFSRDGNRVRCFPHVINIAVKTGLALLTSLSQPLDNDTADADGVTGSEIEVLSTCTDLSCSMEYQEALKNDPIALARNLVASCRASGNRRDELHDIILQMRKEILEHIQQREGVHGDIGDASDDNTDQGSDERGLLERAVVLLRDVDTRWSSIFLMIDRFLELYPAINRLLTTSDSISAVPLTTSELLVLDDVRTYLFAFHSTQEIASAEKTPTLSIVLPLYECLITILKTMKVTLPNLSHIIDASLVKLNEYVDKARRSRIYVLSMVVNPTAKLTWVNDHWLANNCVEARKWIQEAMLDHCRTMLAENSSCLRSTRKPVSRTPSSAARSQGAGILRMQEVLERIQLKSLGSLSTTSSSDSLQSGGTNNNAATSSEEAPCCTTDSIESTEPCAPAAALSAEEIVDQELHRWLSAPIISNADELLEFDLVHYWDQRTIQTEYPILFRIAMDVLPVQASAVPCERVFSSSKETDALRRSRLSPEMMEVLQMLKFVYRAHRLDFSQHWVDNGSEIVKEDRGTMLDLTPSVLREMLAAGQVSDLISMLEA